jgi:hypothetical protein
MARFAVTWSRSVVDDAVIENVKRQQRFINLGASRSGT